MTPFALDHPAVQGYLRRLDLATAHLPSDERVDIVEGIRSHLLTVMAEAETEVDVHRALDALGSPEQIVGTPPPAPAVAAPGPIVVQRPRRESARGPLEVWAVMTVLLGGLIIGLLAATFELSGEIATVGAVGAWLVGVVLLWVSSAWKVGEKLLGTFLVPGGLAGTVAGYFMLVNVAGTSCVGMAGGGSGGRRRMVEECSQGMPTWVGVVLLVIVVLGPIVSAVYLLRVAGRRPAVSPLGSSS